MNDEQYLLANAYVDGELSADERALAETDPDVMSEVGILLSLQTRLRKVDPPSASARESALTAAMAVFPGVEARPAPPINAAVSNPVPVRRRPAYARYLGLAAAVVGIGLLGAVLVTGLRSGADDDSASEVPAAEAEILADEPADEPAAATVAPSADRITESAEAESLAEGESQLDFDAGDDAAADEGADNEVALSDSGPAEQAAEQPAAEPADGAMGDSGDFEQPAFDPSQPLTGPSDLGAYGSYLLELQAAGELPPTPNTDCPQQVLLGQAQYVFDDIVVEVYVVIDDQNRTVSAIDPNTCETLAVGPLY